MKDKLPTYVGHDMTVKHLCQNKELMTILNSFGHSENYSFIVELKTAIANKLKKELPHLSQMK